MKRILIISLISILALPAIFAQGYNVGDKASDFKLKNVDGKYVSLGDYKEAKGYTVIFTCNHCPYAIAYQDRIIELDKKYKELGYPVIAINSNDPEIAPDDSYDKMIIRAKEKKYTFPYLFDETQEVYRKYGAKRTPHVYLLQKKGNSSHTRLKPQCLQPHSRVQVRSITGNTGKSPLHTLDSEDWVMLSFLIRRITINI